MEKFDINNRRYVGSKFKLSDEIIGLIQEHTKGSTFADLFAGTGIISQKMLDYADKIIINDFLYSNEVIYKGFFESNNLNNEKIEKIVSYFNEIEYTNNSTNNYVNENFGNKYFSMSDAYKIGEIRENIESMYKKNEINKSEYNVLLSSLIYSVDKIANTVGHYDAYRKINDIKDRFQFRLISPLDTSKKDIQIYREDANEVVRKLKNIDVSFIDPPYNSRQYSRFYHVLENITQWEKPELFGVAMKPEAENMSDYCRVSARDTFEDLIESLDSKYIVVTYNNTYTSKSNSSRNKIELDELEEILNNKGSLKRFSFDHNHFNSGKTDFKDHKEYVYIVEVYE